MLEIEKRVGEPIEVFLRREYLENKKSTHVIGEMIDVSGATVLKWLKKARIPIKQDWHEMHGYDFVKPSDEQLCKWYINDRKSIFEIGEIVGVSGSTISKWLEKAGIERRDDREQVFAHFGKEIKKPSGEQLCRWYIEEKKSTVEIGEIVGVSYSAINSWLKEAGIPIRQDYYEMHGYDFVKPTNEQLRWWYINEKKSAHKIGEIVGVSKGTVLRWLEEDGINRRNNREKVFADLGKEIVKPTDDQLRRWYVDEKKSTREIGEIIGANGSTIAEWLKKAEIERRGQREARFLSLGKEVVKPSNTQLRRWYIDEGKSTYEIGKIVGVNWATALNWLKEASIPIRQDYYEMHGYDFVKPSRDQLRKWYVDDKKSTIEIAEIVGVSWGTVSNWLKEAGVQIRNQTEAKFVQYGKEIEKPPDERLRKWYINEKRSAAEISTIVDVDKTTILNWLARAGIARREVLYGYKEWLQCADGHKVKSGYERRVDDWLYFNGIAHDYGKELPGARKYKCDFGVGDWHIEVWGLAGIDFYDKKTEEKIAYYEKHGLKCIDIFPDDFGKTNNWMKKLEPLLKFSDPEKRRQRLLEDFNKT